MSKSIFFLLILSLVSCSNTNEQTLPFSQNNPLNNTVDPEVASEFVNQYVNRDYSIDLENWANSSDLTSESFKQELSKIMTKAWEENPEYGLGFDPIINAQDSPEEGYELESYDQKTGHAVVSPIGWEDASVHVKLILVEGKTLVDGCGIVNIPEELRFN